MKAKLKVLSLVLFLLLCTFMVIACGGNENTEPETSTTDGTTSSSETTDDETEPPEELSLDITSPLTTEISVNQEYKLTYTVKGQKSVLVEVDTDVADDGYSFNAETGVFKANKTGTYFIVIEATADDNKTTKKVVTLTVKATSTASLTAAVNSTKSLVPTDYTNWDALGTALESAEESASLSQTEIDSLVQTINNAVQSLTKKAVTKVTEIDDGFTFNGTEYTTGKYLQVSLDTALTSLLAIEADLQSVYDAAAEEILKDLQEVGDQLAIAGVIEGNFYTPHKTLKAYINVPETSNATYKWYIKQADGSYPTQPNSTSEVYDYAPVSGKTSKIKAEITIGGSTYTVESAEFKYNYVPLLTLDQGSISKFGDLGENDNGNLTVLNNAPKSTNNFFDDSGIKELPDLYMDIIFINSFTMEATFEFVSGAKVGSKNAFAGLVSTARRGENNGLTDRGAREYHYGGIDYSGGNDLIGGWSGKKFTAGNYEEAQTKKIRVVVEYTNAFDMTTYDPNMGSDSGGQRAYVIVSFYAEDGSLIGKTTQNWRSFNAVRDNGFVYPGLNFDNVECKVTNIIFKAKEDETVRRDELKKLLDEPGANELGEVYEQAKALYDITDGRKMSKVVSGHMGYMPFEYRDDVASSIAALIAALDTQ